VKEILYFHFRNQILLLKIKLTFSYNI